MNNLAWTPQITYADQGHGLRDGRKSPEPGRRERVKSMKFKRKSP